MTQLDVISPAPVLLQVAGREIKLLPIKLKQLPAVVRVMRPFLSSMSENTDIDSLIGVYCDHADAINAALAEMSGLTLEEVDNLGLDDGLQLFLGCLEVNKDFFIKTLPSMISRLSGKKP